MEGERHCGGSYDLDVPFPLQWELLWFSSPSRLNRKFANVGTKIAKYRETVNMARPSVSVTMNFLMREKGNRRSEGCNTTDSTMCLVIPF